ncbi:lytic murein transglycosylase [Desulfurivibrio alkaliphilus]|uniref:Lytic murein transglycosylase n=1 Tax=Desulfurivibrio alkaliphilus (strain DSM 19089 / UNIQEM U267 / AHT2) TaxID=589865 RepID=D6Z468_DESAT|nr:lytic murein transglycosylase [Desulfurivibrio alkaliphilus]ADH86343.1 lytic murein transglycosylase [Desulfurivibrio alkaliphilus AHT 2]
MKKQGLAMLLIALLMISGPLAGPASAAEQPFEQWLTELRQEAKGRGISATTLDAALTGIEPIPRVIELDRQQPEFTLTFVQYRDRVVPQSRINMGRRLLEEHRELLTEIGKEFGVQPRFIVALWGIETDFGRITGGFPVINALATLAYDGRRSSYFRGELLNALQILDEGHIGVDEMKGSWAGAMGQSQFMPSSFLNFAVDYNGDGRRDIWHTLPDVFASAANYLAKSGWRDDQTWGRAVQLPADFDRSLAGLETRKRIGQWQELGVRRPDGSDLPTRQLMASIIIPDQENHPDIAFMVYENFRTTLRWNRSNYFALAVGLLSDAIAM